MQEGLLSSFSKDIISTYYADNRCNRGRANGFWEALLKKPVIVIQLLTEQLGGVTVLSGEALPGRRSYAENVVYFYYESDP